MAERTTEAWLIAQAQRKSKAAKDYHERALYAALANFAKAQQHQLDLARGEIDGRSWDHTRW